MHVWCDITENKSQRHLLNMLSEPRSATRVAAGEKPVVNNKLHQLTL